MYQHDCDISGEREKQLLRKQCCVLLNLLLLVCVPETTASSYCRYVCSALLLSSIHRTVFKVKGTHCTWNARLLLYSEDHSNQGFRCLTGTASTARHLLLCFIFECMYVALVRAHTVLLRVQCPKIIAINSFLC